MDLTQGYSVRRFYQKMARWVRYNLAPFSSSAEYWERRYAQGGRSGEGSYGKLADYKARIINSYVAVNHIDTVIEFGCGDGNQLRLARYNSYLGLDVSESAIRTCRALFANDESKQFKLMAEYGGETADLALSLDVIYHLVEDQVFEDYMKTLFGASGQHVIIYSHNTDRNNRFELPHVRNRKFTDWVAKCIPDWNLLEHIPNEYLRKMGDQEMSWSDFYIYRKIQ